jgi:hypothetical protein
MTDCIWERGDRERLSFHGADCFDSIERLNIPLNEGHLLQAKFKIEIIQKSTRPVTVTVRVPSRIEVNPRHEVLVNDVLARIGIRGAHANASEHDLWSLYPWRQHIDTWRDCFGNDTDTLVRKGLLVKTQLQSVEPPAARAAGRVLHAEQLSPVDFFGVSQTPEIASRSLSVTDLDALELDVKALQRHLRALFAITGAAVPRTAEEWFLDLGTLDAYDHTFRLVYALREPPTGASDDIRRVCAAATPILLLPNGLRKSTGVIEVLIAKPLPDPEHVLRDIVVAANLEDKVPARFLAPPKARLIVDMRSQKIWFDKVEIEDLKPGTHAFRFVQIMASSDKGVVDKYTLAEQLSAKRDDGDQSARSAKMRATKILKAAVEAMGQSFEDPFKSENGSLKWTPKIGHS